MSDDEFQYTELMRNASHATVGSIIAHQVLLDRPLRAVIWSAQHSDWVAAPATAAALLYDDQNFERLRDVDRATAERTAREALHAELPSVDELNALADEGERMGWDYGPPR